ncbi:hypothetical protein DL766_007897 [Monosporascus sp. MC13-8B]|nr:hypothetical protein DL766_007897 [Monosporascus sp. MC13-8B]
MYEYGPLDSNKHEIRLLELRPALLRHLPLVGTLRTVSLSDRPEYDALSYMWGDPTPSRSITLDGERLPISRNLRDALRDLRGKSKPLVLWTDAICINQVGWEKNYQVPLMGQIYHTAKTVRTWLNTPIKPVSDALELSKAQYPNINLEWEMPSFWYPVAEIFLDPYWQRVWVQQEVCLASRLAVHFRHVEEPGELLLGFARCLDSTDPLDGESVASQIQTFIFNKSGSNYTGYRIFAKHSLQPPATVPHAVEMTQLSPAVSIPLKGVFNLYRASKLLQATDSRDKVYGLLGLAHDGADFPVDYSLSPLQVYGRLAQHYASRYRSLNFLACISYDESSSLCPHDLTQCSGSNGPYICLHAPSWLPTPIRVVRDVFDGIAGAAGHIPPPTATFDLSTSRMALTVRGFLLDTIAALGTPQDLDCMTLSELEEEVTRMFRASGEGEATTEGAAFLTDLLRLKQERSNYPALAAVDILPAVKNEDGKLHDFLYCVAWLRQNLVSLLLCCSLRELLEKEEDMLRARSRWLPTVAGAGEHFTKIETARLRLNLIRILLGCVVRRRLVRTEKGRVGLASASANVGDKIMVVLGCPAPLVLRRCDGSRGCRIVSRIWISGVMEGQVCNALGISGDGVPNPMFASLLVDVTLA